MTSDELLREWCEGRVTKQQVDNELDYRQLRDSRQYKPNEQPASWFPVVCLAAVTLFVLWWTRN